MKVFVDKARKRLKNLMSDEKLEELLEGSESNRETIINELKQQLKYTSK